MCSARRRCSILLQGPSLLLASDQAWRCSRWSASNSRGAAQHTCRPGDCRAGEAHQEVVSRLPVPAISLQTLQMAPADSNAQRCLLGSECLLLSAVAQHDSLSHVKSESAHQL